MKLKHSIKSSHMFDNNVMKILPFVIFTLINVIITFTSIHHKSKLRTYNKEYQTITDSICRFSDIVMERNNLWDTDGSDEMFNLIKYRIKLDSLRDDFKN